MDIYERNFNIKVQRVSDDLVAAKASMLDLDHNIFVELTVDVNTREIKSADARMVMVPHDDLCAKALDNIKKVEGLKIEQGLAKKVSSVLGGSTGCTHVVEIFMSAARVVSNVIIGFLAEGMDWKELDLEKGELGERLRPYLEDSCIVFKKN